jgi:hypothetical protein
MSDLLHQKIEGFCQLTQLGLSKGIPLGGHTFGKISH